MPDKDSPRRGGIAAPAKAGLRSGAHVALQQSGMSMTASHRRCPRVQRPGEPGEGGIAHGVLGADPRQHRRRLRRHRHQPALRLPRGGRRPRSAPSGRRRASAVLGVLSLILWALIVVVTLEIRPHPAARRQQRRGRHAGADGAGAARAAAKARGLVVLLGIISARAVLRRRRHHAGAVGAVGGRRPEDRHAGLRPLRRAADGRHPDRAVRGAVARHRQRRGLLRPDHAGLVRRASRSPASGTSPTIPTCCCAFNPALCASASCSATA